MNERIKYLLEERESLKISIKNRDWLIGDYDKDADYETALAEVEQELYEKDLTFFQNIHLSYIYKSII